MLVIIGAIIVLASVLIGFSMAGGSVGSLIHISEFITIGGATFGALIIMSPKKVIVDLFKGILQTLKGSPYNKATCSDLLKLLYGLARVVRQEGALGIEQHIGNPSASALFQASPRVYKNHHLKHFICEGLALIVDGKIEPPQLATFLEQEQKVLDIEHHAAVGALSKTADALPGFGIVAAVLGIVVTMQSIGGPVEEIGEKVGAALVGTFLGILMAYGFFAPLAGRMESLGEQETAFLKGAAEGIMAIHEGSGPRDVAARARRVISTDCRPSQSDMTALFAAA